jgi:hypothetical protein
MEGWKTEPDEQAPRRDLRSQDLVGDALGLLARRGWPRARRRQPLLPIACKNTQVVDIERAALLEITLSEGLQGLLPVAGEDAQITYIHIAVAIRVAGEDDELQ